jgi:hypothetical protein
MTVIKYAQLHPERRRRQRHLLALQPPSNPLLLLFWVQLRAPSLLLDHILDGLSITVDHGAN